MGNLVSRTVFGEVVRHRRRRSYRVEDGPAGFAMIAVIDVDAAKEDGRGIGAKTTSG
jgi:hypothetical protein